MSERDREEAEQGRVHAEAARVRAEGQNGPNEPDRRAAEDGRVHAETGRVHAETRRESLYLMPAWVPQSKTSALVAAFCMLLVVGVPSGLVSYSLATKAAEDQAARITAQQDLIIQAQIGTCERVTQDRVDNARAWTQAEETWKARSLDSGLSSTERDRAAEAATIYGESANQLRSRLFKCGPLIRDDEKVIDEALLREAQGEL